MKVVLAPRFVSGQLSDVAGVARLSGEVFQLRTAFRKYGDECPRGYQKIRVAFKIDGDMSDEAKQELVQLAQRRSAVFDSLTRPVPAEVCLQSD